MKQVINLNTSTRMYTLEVLNWHQLGQKTIITHRQLKTAWSDIKPCLFYIWDTRDPQQRPWTAAELCQISGCYRRSPRWVCEWHCTWRQVQSNPPDQWAAAVVPREAHSPMTWWIGLWITIPSRKMLRHWSSTVLVHITQKESIKWLTESSMHEI